MDSNSSTGATKRFDGAGEDAARQVLKSRSACKNSEKFWWTTKFQNMKTLHASSSHEASLELIFKRREDLGKQSVKTHFPEDRNCEICHRTNKYKGAVVLRAEKMLVI